MKTSVAIIHWTPRILCILALLFISIFSLDEFGTGLPVWKQILGFLMHSIPAFVLLLFLVVAWKWELIGGLILAIAGLGLTPFIYTHNFSMNHSVLMSLSIVGMITFPFFLVGVLFIVSYFMKKRV